MSLTLLVIEEPHEPEVIDLVSDDDDHLHAAPHAAPVVIDLTDDHQEPREPQEPLEAPRPLRRSHRPSNKIDPGFFVSSNIS